MAEQEKSDFWDTSFLVPPAKRPTLQSFIPSVTPQDYKVTSPIPETMTASDRTLHLPGKQSKTEMYIPVGNMFLVSVNLRYEGACNYYPLFSADAVRLFPLNRDDGDYIRFFSYMPQYSQMTEAQIKYYLTWRSALRKGGFLRCDDGYFYLFVYETLHLAGNLIPPAEALELLCRAWCGYAPENPAINKYMAEWVMDFCLIHRLPCPYRAVYPMIRAVLDAAKVREFYMGALSEMTAETTELLLALLSDYDWHRSRYATGETLSAYATHIPHSLYTVFDGLFAGGEFSLHGEEKATVEHSAFCGALIAGDERISVTLTYHPYRGATLLRQSITAAVKYSENILRSRLGLRSRLTVQTPDSAFTRPIDAYYRVMYNDPAPKKAAVQTVAPAYEALYEAPDDGFDYHRADTIEELSWETTRRLVPEEEKLTMWDAETARGKSPSPAIQDEEYATAEQVLPVEGCFGLDGVAVDFLRCVLSGDINRRSDAADEGLVERINTAFAEQSDIGDIILEKRGDGYAVIDDYIDEVKQWMIKFD